MSAFIATAGRWGGIMAVILLVITLLKQLIALVSFIMVAIKIMIVIAFVALMLLVVMMMMRGRSQRRREAEEL